MSGLLSHAGPSIPTIAKVRLIRPSEGCINTANVIPTATALMSTGKKMIERSAERMWILDVRSVASSRPRMTFEPLVTTAYTNVLRRPLGERWVLEELAEVVEADEGRIEQRPTRETEVERGGGRDEEDHREQQDPRDVEPPGVHGVEGSVRRLAPRRGRGHVGDGNGRP